MWKLVVVKIAPEDSQLTSGYFCYTTKSLVKPPAHPVHPKPFTSNPHPYFDLISQPALPDRRPHHTSPPRIPYLARTISNATTPLPRPPRLSHPLELPLVSLKDIHCATRSVSLLLKSQYSKKSKGKTYSQTTSPPFIIH